MAVQLHYDGVLAVPVHSAGAGFDDMPAGQQHAVPFLLQRRPAAFDRIIFAVIRRIVNEVNF